MYLWGLWLTGKRMEFFNTCVRLLFNQGLKSPVTSFTFRSACLQAGHTVCMLHVKRHKYLISWSSSGTTISSSRVILALHSPFQTPRGYALWSNVCPWWHGKTPRSFTNKMQARNGRSWMNMKLLAWLSALSNPLLQHGAEASPWSRGLEQHFLSRLNLNLAQNMLGMKLARLLRLEL